MYKKILVALSFILILALANNFFNLSAKIYQLLPENKQVNLLKEKNKKAKANIVKKDTSKKYEYSINILTFGDLMLDRYVRVAMNKKSLEYPFEQIKTFIADSKPDLIYANLEGPITDFAPKKLHPNNLTFTFDPSVTPILAQTGFNVLGLANNHSLNYGQVGLDQTRNYLTQNNIYYFGSPLNQEKLSYIIEKSNQKLAFVGYNELSTNNFEKVKTSIQKIKQEKLADFIIFFPHWGNEYQTKFSKLQQQKAHEIIDYGADLIIGTHPHVIQPIEIYNQKVIFYSLGNFLFDQTFSVNTQQGIGVNLNLHHDKITFNLHPHHTDNFQIKLLPQDKAQTILNTIATNSAVSEEIKEEIKRGRFETKK